MRLHINLLPAHYRPKPSVRVWPVALTIALMLNLILTSSYWLTLQMDLTQTSSDLHSAESEVANLRRLVEEEQWKEALKTSVKAKADYIEAQVRDSILWYPAVALLEQALLPGISVNSINFSASGDISITGSTDRVETAANFWGSLQSTTGLEIIRLSSVAPAGSFNFILRGWYGREVETDDVE